MRYVYKVFIPFYAFHQYTSFWFSKIRRVIQRAVKGLLVIREYPIIFPVKCEMACFLRVNRDTIRNRKMWLSKIITGILVVTSIIFDGN